MSLIACASNNTAGKNAKAKASTIVESRILHPDDTFPISTLPDWICSAEVPNDLLCQICQGIAQNVVIDCCEHVYCYGCLQMSMTYSNKCPATNLPWSESTITPVRPLQNIINQLDVCCFRKECSWKGKMEKLKNHINNDCLCVRVLCKNNGCGAFEVALHMKNHEKVCLFANIYCKHCSIQLLRMNYPPHEEQCKEKVIDCVKDCGKQVKRKDMDNHFNKECQNAHISCEFFPMGCQQQIIRSAYNNHLKQCHNLYFLSGALSGLQNDVKKLSTSITYITENDHQENKKKNSSKKKKKDTQEKSRIIINTKLSKLENNIECLMSSVNTIVSLEEEKDLDSASPLAGKTLDKTQEEQSKKITEILNYLN